MSSSCTRWARLPPLVVAAALACTDAVARPSDAPPPAERDVAELARLATRTGDFVLARELASRDAASMSYVERGLLSGRTDVRSGALRLLQALPDRATDWFGSALADRDPRRRETAADVLGDLAPWWKETAGAPALVDALAAGLATSGDAERLLLLRAITRCGPRSARAYAAVLPLVDARDAQTGDAAASALAAMGAVASPASSRVWRRAFAAGEPAGRAQVQRASVLFGAAGAVPPDAACRALFPEFARGAGRIAATALIRAATGPERRDVLRTLLTSDRAPVRRAAWRAFCELPGAEAEAVAYFAADPEDVDIRRLRRSEAALRALLEEAREGDAVVRAALLPHLYVAGDESRGDVVDLLRRASADADPLLRRSALAAYAEGGFSSAECRAVLEPALADPDALVRGTAEDVFARRFDGTGDLDAARIVAPGLARADPDDRARALALLGRIGALPPESAEHLVACLESPLPAVHTAAAQVAWLLGPAVAEHAARIVVIARDDVRDDVFRACLRSLSASGDEASLQASLDYLTWESPARLAAVLREFGPRAAFLEKRARARLREMPTSELGAALLASVDDPDALVRRLDADEPNTRGSLTDLGSSLARLRPIRWIADRRARRGDEICYELCSAAWEGRGVNVARLLDETSAAAPDERAMALLVAADIRASGGHAAFLEALRADDARVRGAGASGLAAEADAGAVLDDVDRADLLRLLDDDAPARAGPLELLAALGPARTVDADLTARVRRALGDEDPATRVAAAAALVRLTGETDGALEVLRRELRLPACRRWVRGGDDDSAWEPFGASERALPQWEEVARAVRRIGALAAPLADELRWAALRAEDSITQSALWHAHRVALGAGPR